MNTRLIHIFFKISKAIQQEPIYFFGSLGRILVDLSTDNFLLASASQEFTTYNKPKFRFLGTPEQVKTN